MIHKALFTFQSYFMGCAFDSFSTSWNDRSYVITLLVLAWLTPLFLICFSYIAIIFRVRHSLRHIKLLKSNTCFGTVSNEFMVDGDIPLDKNVEQRVSSHLGKFPNNKYNNFIHHIISGKMLDNNFYKFARSRWKLRWLEWFVSVSYTHLTLPTKA